MKTKKFVARIMLVSCSLLLYFAVIFAHSSVRPREKTLCTNIYLIDVMVSDLHCLNFLFALEKKLRKETFLAIDATNKRLEVFKANLKSINNRRNNRKDCKCDTNRLSLGWCSG